MLKNLSVGLCIGHGDGLTKMNNLLGGMMNNLLDTINELKEIRNDYMDGQHLKKEQALTQAIKFLEYELEKSYDITYISKYDMDFER